ncbi:glycosyltransferase [Caulobacter sp. BP25]|uniref:glycosyltransferase n=1 Tax=Caulobacter sp. BP25 TaxID=2048900 RepID=UPI000C12D6ED|nr:glycosyltransferase [Caulobacter sp. BP25]PHY22901.1 glycoside hydrolase [Caulobacter sp. BP25]
MLRVLLITEPSGGGSGRHVVDLAEGLCALGHEVSVIYSSTRAEPRFNSELHALPLRSIRDLPMKRSVGPWDLGAAYRLAQMIRKSGPFDIVHAHSSKAGALLRLVAPRGSTRIYTPHAFRTMDPTMGAKGRVVFGTIEAILARYFTDALIAVAPEEVQHAHSLGVPPDKIHLVVNGVTPAREIDREAARSELGIAPGELAVGFVGRLADQKDPLRFAQALKIARESNSRLRGIILGSGELASAVKSAGGDAVTIFEGCNARDFLPAFDLFAMTSKYEAMPYVLLEALQAGLPIVSTQVGGVSITVRNGENGFVVPVSASPEELVGAILSAAADEQRKKFAAVSSEMASQFGADKMAKETNAVYSSAIRARAKS